MLVSSTSEIFTDLKFDRILLVVTQQPFKLESFGYPRSIGHERRYNFTLLTRSRRRSPSCRKLAPKFDHFSKLNGRPDFNSEYLDFSKASQLAT